MPTITANAVGRSGMADDFVGSEFTSVEQRPPAAKQTELASRNRQAQTVSHSARSSRLTSLFRRRYRSRLSPLETSIAPQSTAASPVDTADSSSDTRATTVRSKPAAEDRRRFPRRASRSVVRVLKSCDELPSTPGRDWAFWSDGVRGELIDISMNGALFLTTESLETNTSIELRLAHPLRDFSTTRRSRVVRCEPHDAGRWKITCCFEHCLTLDEVIQLGNAWT